MFRSGLADTRVRRPVQAVDHFRIGSVTKTFVAAVALQLVGERRLSLSDTVEERLPGLVPGGDKITLRELLQHTSGLYDYTNDPRTFAPYLKGNLAFAWKPKQLVATAVAHAPLFDPGAQWSYSNTNDVLLGLIVEAVTKNGLANELARRVFRPLGLHQTRSARDDVCFRGTATQRSAPGCALLAERVAGEDLDVLELAGKPAVSV